MTQSKLFLIIYNQLKTQLLYTIEYLKKTCVNCKVVRSKCIFETCSLELEFCSFEQS